MTNQSAAPPPGSGSGSPPQSPPESPPESPPARPSAHAPAGLRPINVTTEEALRQRLFELEQERELLIRQKRRNLLLAGAAISLLVHVSIMLYLASVVRVQGSGAVPVSVFVEFSTITEEELTDLDYADLAVDDPQALADITEMPAFDPLLNLEIQPPAAELEVGNTGSLATLGGSAAGGGDMALGGGSASTSFFGVSSSGTRFIFIVDISGSMSGESRMSSAMRELSRSIQTLPDYAYFMVLLYSSEIYWPPWQTGWQRARERDVGRMVAWLNQVSPGGGTYPLPAFTMAFAQDPQPDVIFFLTDGIIPQETAESVSQLNRGSRKTVINTIAFGDAGSQDQLRRIASESGGLYRFVKTSQ